MLLPQRAVLPEGGVQIADSTDHALSAELHTLLTARSHRTYLAVELQHGCLRIAALCELHETATLPRRYFDIDNLPKGLENGPQLLLGHLRSSPHPRCPNILRSEDVPIAYCKARKVWSGRHRRILQLFKACYTQWCAMAC